MKNLETPGKTGRVGRYTILSGFTHSMTKLPNRGLSFKPFVIVTTNKLLFPFKALFPLHHLHCLKV